MAESEEVLNLRRRARRRLIGATALVLFLVVVPPWLMDLEPRPVTSNLSVEIPGKDAPKIDARALPVPSNPTESTKPAPSAPVTPIAPEAKPAPEAAKQAESAPKPAAPVAEPAKSAKGADVAVAKPAAPAPKPMSDGERAAAILKNEVFFFQLGAFNNRDNAKALQQKVAQAGVKTSADVIEVKGVEQTRVTAGPFPSREAAEKARGRLKEIGLEPGPVRSR